MGRDHKNELIKIIRKDAEFFAKQNIIDYSLLVGVHNKREHLNEPYEESSVSDFKSERGGDMDNNPFTRESI